VSYIEEPYILMTDKKISAVQDILPILEQMTQQGIKKRCTLHTKRTFSLCLFA